MGGAALLLGGDGNDDVEGGMICVIVIPYDLSPIFPGAGMLTILKFLDYCTKGEQLLAQVRLFATPAR